MIQKLENRVQRPRGDHLQSADCVVRHVSCPSTGGTIPGAKRHLRGLHRKCKICDAAPQRFSCRMHANSGWGRKGPLAANTTAFVCTFWSCGCFKTPSEQ